MKRKRYIPFWLTPKSWFSSGYTKDLARIDHEYVKDSYEWMVNKAKVFYSHDKIRLNEALLGIDLDFEKITQYEYDIAMLDFKYDKDIDSYVYDKALIEIDFKHGEIDHKEREKRLATLDEIPWGEVNLISDPDNPDFGTFVPDYNEYYVEWLREHGYSGERDEDVIDDYVNHICKFVAIENFDGVGDFSEIISESEVQANAHAKRRVQPQKNSGKDGRTRYE